MPLRYGISCASGEVVDLYLPSLGIYHTLPSELGLLTALTGSFDLGGNPISGEIPSQLGELTGINTYFKVAQASFSGELAWHQTVAQAHGR